MNTKSTLFIFLLILVVLILSCNSKKKYPQQCEQVPKYLKVFELPEKLIGYNNYEQAVDCARKTDKPLAVYITGYACKNCRDFEEKFLNSDEVSKLLNEHFVFAALLIDIKKELPKEDQFVVTRSNGTKRKVKTIGHLNGYIAASKYMNSSQPYLFIRNSRDSIVARIGYSQNKEELLKELKAVIEK